MNEYKVVNILSPQYGGKLLAAILGIALFAGMQLNAAEPAKAKAQKPAVVSVTSKKPIPASTELVPRMELSLGQSHLVRLPAGVNLQKVKVDDEKVVQVEVTSPREVVIYAKSAGSTSVIIWDKSGKTTVIDVSVVGVTVSVDAKALQNTLQLLLPSESDIKVMTAADSLVLTGMVADAVAADTAVTLAESYVVSGKGKATKVINLLRVAAPQQVMLEVKMAEVSKNLLDRLGAQVGATLTNGGTSYAIASGFLSLLGGGGLSDGLGGLITIKSGTTTVRIDAESKDGIVKLLAEPNIIAISGQEAAFLAGGKIFIPVQQSGTFGGITLQEETFGIGLKFTPTVLHGGLINLKVSPEVSEISPQGVEITAGAQKNVFPAFVIRRATTTVQLHDGQSFAIAGLIKNNVVESIRRFPILGEIPILGALFRSSEFRDEKTELLFVITPRLVKPLSPDYVLPTDNFNPPDKAEFLLNGQLEGKPAAPVAPAVPPGKVPAPPPSAVVPEQKATPDGFEMK